MNTEANRHEYRGNNSIDLNLTQNEVCDLMMCIADDLGTKGIKMMHDQVVERGNGFHPDSHIGHLVNIYARLDAAYHGRKTWNKDR